MNCVKKGIIGNLKILSIYKRKKNVMRAGPQLRVDAYASVAAFGHESLQAASRDTHFAHFCEGRTGPSLHPPHHPWPTPPFSRRNIIILKLYNHLSRLLFMHKYAHKTFFIFIEPQIIASGPYWIEKTIRVLAAN